MTTSPAVGSRSALPPGSRGEWATADAHALWQSVGQRSPVTLPAAWGRGAGAPAERAELCVPLADLADGLASLAADAATTVPTVLLAAHLTVLGMLTMEPESRSDLLVTADPAGEDGGPQWACLPVPVRRDARTWRRLVALTGQDERAARQHRRRVPAAARGRRGGGEVLAGLDLADWPAAVRAPGSVGHGLHVLLTDRALRLRVDVETIAAGHLERLAALYRTVLEAMCGDPDGDPRAACLPPGERQAVLRTWSTGAPADRSGTTVVDLLRDQVSATPDAVAVRVGGVTLTYRELDERSNQIARHVAGLGAGADVLVGVCLERTPDLLPALLGVWKAGAAYLPLDPGLPGERLRRMVTAAGCPLVLTTARHRPLLDVEDVALVLLDDQRAAVAAQPRAPLPVRVAEAQLAYVIYTSGSTGTPKGVMVEHGGLANYLLWTVEAYAARGTGGAPVFSSISFDLGIPNLFTPLLAGQAVHLLPDPLELDELGPELAAGGPYSFVKMTPGHLDLLTWQLTEAEIGRLAGIAIAAGDSFTSALAARWIELAGADGTQVATEYGPTEITIGNSGQPIVDLPATELVPLGRPIPATTMYVLSDHLEPVPIGVPGEVCVGGRGVARGYLGRPDLTADRFVPDPHGAAGARLYRTGDVARWLPDGSLDFLGRLDDQIKIRGYRVELGEIRAALCRCPGVRDAVVRAYEPVPGDKRLVAYVVLAAGQPLDAATLRGHLAATLPDHMVPAAYVAIDHVPLTTNGKVDSRALPALL